VEEKGRADTYIEASLREGRVIPYDQFFPMTSMARSAERYGYDVVDRVSDTTGRRRGVVMHHNAGHKMVILGDRGNKSAVALHNVAGGTSPERVSHRKFKSFMRGMYGR
jgi:hypothetical protein